MEKRKWEKSIVHIVAFETMDVITMSDGGLEQEDFFNISFGQSGSEPWES